MLGGLREREVRQVRGDQVERARDRVEQVAVQHGDAIGEPQPRDVRSREQHRFRAGVGREHLRARKRRREGDSDRSRTGADVRDARRPIAEQLDRRLDEAFRRRPRCHHPAGPCREAQAEERRM